MKITVTLYYGSIPYTTTQEADAEMIMESSGVMSLECAMAPALRAAAYAIAGQIMLDRRQHIPESEFHNFYALGGK